MRHITPTQLRTELLTLIHRYMGLTAHEAAQKLDVLPLDVTEQLYGLGQAGLIGPGDIRYCTVGRFDSVTFWAAEDLAEVEVAA